MQTRTRVPRSSRKPSGARVLGHLAAFAALGAAGALGFGCTEPRPTGAAPRASAIIIISGRPGVLNTQFREVNAMNWQVPVTGHLQLTVSREGLLDQVALLEWKGMILNPTCVTFGGGGIYYLPAVQGPEWPSSEDRAVVEIPGGAGTDCGDIPLRLEGTAVISMALAERLITNPENFVVAFFGDGGGMLAGTLQIGNPNEAPTR